MAEATERRYFARVSAGLEQVAWDDIAQRTGARLLGMGHRRLDFAYVGPPAVLLTLRSVDDVYALVARLNGLDHTRASLPRLSKKIAALDFGSALAAVEAARALPEYPKYRVTASHLGRRNYSRYDVEGAIEQALTPLLPWRFVLNDADEPEPELDLRVLLEDDWALLGLRLGTTPLHRRADRLAERPGALKPPVAYCMALLAGCAPGQTLLDPTCGAGTILAEALALLPGGVLIGGDIDAEGLLLAQENLAACDAPVQMAAPGAIINPHAESAGVVLYQGDARAVPLPAASVDALVCNPPWGRQVAPSAELSALYGALLGEAARVLVPGGRAVLLTDQHAALAAALAELPTLQLRRELAISLFGSHPRIYVLECAASAT
ncbi:MAG TPA: methyltransferase [Kouleothrix sp.]|nr:methyltransferase [Kouleothrix sp.]